MHLVLPYETEATTVQRRLLSRHRMGPPESPEQLSPSFLLALE